jgi:hypothetical protein
MADYLLCIDFNIFNGKEIAKSDGFCIDARHYLSQHLECDWGDVENYVQKTADNTFKSIAKWAANGCDYISGLMQESISEIETSIATEIADSLVDQQSEDYDEIFEEIFDNISHKITKLELIIDGKVYIGK